MANQTKVIKFIFLTFMCIMFVYGVTGQALADQCITSGQEASQSIGSRCAEDPSCMIVGETHMLEWKASTPAKIVVVCIHGLGLCARAYRQLAQDLSAAGIDGFGVNVRGFGPDRDKPDRAKLNCVKTVGDVSDLLAGIRKEHPDYKVFLVGESMGGALAIRIAAENPELVDGIICSAPAWKLLKLHRTAVNGVFELFLFPTSHPGPAGRGVIRQATTDPNLAEHWLTDSSHRLKLSLGEATAFLKFISKTDSYAKQLTAPVLIVQGLNDHLVSPNAVAKLFKNIPSRNKSFLIVGKGEHLVLEEGGFSPALATKLINWMKTDSALQTVASTVEVLDDQPLSPEEKRQVSKLQRLAKTQYEVKWAGSLRNVHHGIDFAGQIDLNSLAALPHLYAVGPLENLQGEITIWDGKALISRIKNQQLQVDNQLTGKACFLVYGQAASWKTIKLKSSLSLSQVDEIVKSNAIKYGIDTQRPFPFLLSGTAKSARYHIMNRTDAKPPAPGPGSHETAKVHFTIDNSPVELLGFYSEKHQGIFTHHNSFVHLHIKTPDDKIAGHLENVELEPGATLLLPEGYGYEHRNHHH